MRNNVDELLIYLVEVKYIKKWVEVIGMCVYLYFFVCMCVSVYVYVYMCVYI